MSTRSHLCIIHTYPDIENRELINFLPDGRFGFSALAGWPCLRTRFVFKTRSPELRLMTADESNSVTQNANVMLGISTSVFLEMVRDHFELDTKVSENRLTSQ
jgi:hypothetical protein